MKPTFIRILFLILLFEFLSLYIYVQWDQRRRQYLDRQYSDGVSIYESRSPEWPRVRAEHLEKEPICVICGSKLDIQVHHILPYRKYPELELDGKNLITLCGSKMYNHHFLVGHAGNYMGWNPHVREDSRLLKVRWEESRKLAKE